MAKAAPLGSLYAEGPEEQTLADEIKGSYAKLREALEARQNPLFDPVLLAMSQGFLTPTKTGSFGEALGNVAAAIGPAQQAEEKRAQEIASMKMELAQRELAQRQATRTDEMFRGMLRPPEGAPSSAAPPEAAAPAGGAPGVAAPAGGAPPTQGRPVTPEDIARLASMPGGAEKAKILKDLVTMNRDRFSISMNGIVFDKDTKQYLNLEIPGQKQEPFSTPYGRFEMTPYEYSQYKREEAAGRGQEWIDAFRGVKPAAGVAPAAAPAAPGGRKTIEEQQAEAEAAKVRATETAKAEAGRTQSAIETGSNVTDRLASINALRGIVARPDSSQIFGIFNRPDVATAILNLVQEGVKAPGQTSIQAGALEDTLRNVGIPQAQIDRYRFALSVMANIQLQQAKLAAGQGSVSNFERDLFANATLSPKDNPATIMAKLSMLEARAQFDRQIGSELRKSKMTVDDFRETDQYQNMVNSYLQRVSSIASNLGQPAAARPQGAAPRPSGAASAPYSAARDKLRKEMGLP